MYRAADGSLVIGGSASIPNGLGHQALVMKVAANGDSLWSLLYPAQPNPYDSVVALAIAPMTDGGYILTGRNGSCPFLLKVTATGTIGWSYSYTTFYFAQGCGVVQAADTALLMVGWNGVSTPSLFNLRTSRTGGIRWSRTNYGFGYGLTVLATPDSGATVAGRLEGSSTGAALMHLNFRGDTVWSRVYDAGSTLEIAAVQRTADRGMVLAGTWNSSDRDAYVVLTDSVGHAVWRRHFGGNLNNEAHAVLQLQNGSFIVAGNTETSGRQLDGLLARLAPDGSVLWTQMVGDASDDALTALALADSGGFYAAGTFQSPADQTADICLLRFPPGSGIQGVIRDSVTGRPVPNVRVSRPGSSDEAHSDSAGRYALYTTPGTYDFIINGTCVARDTVRGVEVLPDSMMAQNWAARLPQIRLAESSINPVVHNHIPTTVPVYVHNDGPGVLDFTAWSQVSAPRSPWLSVAPLSGSIAAGDSLALQVRVQADTTNGGVFDYLGAVFIDANSCPDTLRHVSVSASILETDSRPDLRPVRYDLSVYPNPFNPQTTLSLSLPQRTMVSLVLYDVTGRVVRTLCDGVREAGVRRFNVDGSALPSGLYFARVETPAYSRTQKLVLLK
jgi:hypothetical protein